ncbi:hypothetical protein [Halomonas sp. 707B3]|uniref:hypothetical protein n=1 Tax=Halomonas sp. 707B3 TaxID=1681043 RepID=UPI0020A17345|nr:hypothetical protein [Halomonas sp. 707B3]MCP1316863.1 hypothetical protein [Halomonas sp. 707B3]
MKLNVNTTMNKLASTSTKRAVQTFAPLITGDQSPGDWIHHIISTTIPEYNRQGEVLKYKRLGMSAMWQAPWALTTLTKEMWAAHLLGITGYAQTVGKLNELNELLTIVQGVIHSEMESATSNNKRLEVPPTLAVHTRIRSLHRNPESSGFNHSGELAALIEDQHADAEYEASGLAYDVSEEQTMARYEREAQSNGVRNNSGKPAPDEGWLDVALHEPRQLFEYNPRDIQGMQGLLTQVLVRVHDLKLPTDHPMWEPLLERLTEAWAATASYFPNQALVEAREQGLRFSKDDEAANKRLRKKIDARIKELNAEHEKKCAKRALILTQGLLAQPPEDMEMSVGTYERWAVNHATRRIWRDMGSLSRLKDRIEEQIDKVVAQEFDEERSGRPNPTWARSLANDEGQGEDQGQERTWYLAGWGEVTEEECLVDVCDASRNQAFGAVITTQDWSVGDVEATRIGGTKWIKEDVVRDTSWFETYTGPDGKKRVSRRTISAQFDTAGQKEVAILRRVLERCDETLINLRSLYKEMRALDKALAPVWKALHTPKEELKEGEPLMPEQPPVYWNMRGHYGTQEEAVKAMKAEGGSDNVMLLEACGDRARARLQAMLVGTKFDK